MNAIPIRAAAMAALFALALAGCGGHTDTSSTTTTTQDNAAASPGANAENAASPSPTNGAMTAGMEGNSCSGYQKTAATSDENLGKFSRTIYEF